MCAMLKPSDFIVAHDQVVLAVADRQDGIESGGIDLEIHGSGRGQGKRVQVGEAQAGAATGIGEGAIQLIAKVEARWRRRVADCRPGTRT